MPPKTKVTKDAIIHAAVELVRKNGHHAINARTIATSLGCSTQPIFSNFATMDALRLAIVERSCEIFSDYMQQEVESGKYPPYKASGMAYIRFAKEEQELFQLLFMRERDGSTLPQEMDLTSQMESFVHSNTGLNGTDVQLFHLEMWAYVHGIATMFATGYLNLDWELVSDMLTDSYQGLRKQHSQEQ